MIDSVQSYLGSTERGQETRAAVYARTSSTGQRFGYSIDEQIRQCFERCKLLGWTVSYLFRDEAESGKDIDRPMFQKMRQTAELGRFDVVVFWKLDRFSRSLLHVVELESEFREWGVALHSVTEQIDTTTSAGRFNFRNIASAAEFERDMISERTQMEMKALALEKRWPNNHPPVGYKKTESGKLEIDVDEAQLVEDIFSEYLRMKSMPQLARELNEDERTTPRIREWTPRAVRDILTNELYVGTYSVAGITEHVDEYQIIPKQIYEEVTEVRNRFRSRTDSRRSSMPISRKSELIDGVVDQYREFTHS